MSRKGCDWLGRQTSWWLDQVDEGLERREVDLIHDALLQRDRQKRNTMGDTRPISGI